MVRAVSRRSEPSSRTLLRGEQPHSWDLLQPRARASRHRGAERGRRCGLSGHTSLFNPFLGLDYTFIQRFFAGGGVLARKEIPDPRLKSLSRYGASLGIL